MTQQQLDFDQTVRDRIESLLARCARLHQASDLHVMFDAKGEHHARAVAERDRGVGRMLEPLPPKS